MWVTERLIRIQFPLPVHEAARAYFLDLNRAVWEGLPDGESVRDRLENNRLAFLDADGPWLRPGGSTPGRAYRSDIRRVYAASASS
ncbi:hypothetical protein GCM10010277_85040 [Streptomyces longisporoflavus]|nr:hypothetical protein GCM10010277_85040 [Streptomyces longisporoflavus]